MNEPETYQTPRTILGVMLIISWIGASISFVVGVASLSSKEKSFEIALYGLLGGCLFHAIYAVAIAIFDMSSSIQRQELIAEWLKANKESKDKSG